jgi:mono/diheme cytochrome c family protein
MLVNQENTYSRQRLGSYGHVTRGWDVLPEWNPRSVPVDARIAAGVRGAGEVPPLPEGTSALWDGRRPETVAGWVALGREVFFRYPLRSEVYMEHGLAHPETLAASGVTRAADGSYPGLVLFRDVDGRARIGITCASCHTEIDRATGTLVAGEARRAFDYGALRLAYHRDTGAPVDPEHARRMAIWGPGRADVTEDVAEDPVAIPDLWGLRAQTFLTHAGTIRQVSPTALAIRQETQLLHTNHQRIRPPRELAWALAMYLYSLEPPPAVAAAGDEIAVAERGADLFETRCARCHENDALGGRALGVARVGTDPELANGTARGTGMYRPPALIRVSRAAPYFHHGAVATLDDVLAPERLHASFTGSPLGPGPVPGHRFGTDLPAPDRAAIVAYLRTL